MVSGNLGRAAAHKTVVDRPPWAEPLSLRPCSNLKRLQPTNFQNPWQLLLVDTMDGGMGSLNPQSYRSCPAPFISAAWKLLELWDLTGDGPDGALTRVGRHRKFSARVDVSGNEAPISEPGSLECPHEAPTWRARPTSSVVEPPARVPLGIHCWQSGARE